MQAQTLDIQHKTEPWPFNTTWRHWCHLRMSPWQVVALHRKSFIPHFMFNMLQPITNSLFYDHNHNATRHTQQCHHWIEDVIQVSGQDFFAGVSDLFDINDNPSISKVDITCFAITTNTVYSYIQTQSVSSTWMSSKPFFSGVYVLLTRPPLNLDHTRNQSSSAFRLLSFTAWYFILSYRWVFVVESQLRFVEYRTASLPAESPPSSQW